MNNLSCSDFGMSEKNRIIFHVDMDHFYAAVEARENPSLRGRPVVVGADPKEGKGRGVVMTCNYEAREFGIRSGMPISRAWKRCPTAVYLPPNFPLYVKTSSEIMKTLREYSRKFQGWGLDEAFLDVTSSVDNYEKTEALAREIKKEILQNQKLTCSIGVGPNKLVAKIASDHKKPDGLTVVRPEKVREFLSPLPVRRLLWVGKKTEKRLNALGVKTIGEITKLDTATLTDEFGVAGRHIHLMAQGIDNSEVREGTGQVKSIGRERTFEEDTADSKAILETLDRLSETVHKDLARRDLYFKTVTLKVRYKPFRTHTHAKSMPFMTDRLVDLKKTIRELADRHIEHSSEVRLLGVRVSKLGPKEGQKTLL